MCGDATKREDVEKLMAGKKANMVFTDPPYNVKLKYKSYQDNKTREEYREFCSKFFENLKSFSNSRIIITPGSVNVGMWDTIENFYDMGAWIKTNANTHGFSTHFKCFEPILFWGKYKRKRKNDIYEYNLKIFKTDEALEYHSCPKPMALMLDLVENFSERNQIVLDIFGGSGSTLIACEQLNRKCYMCEIDEKYCDVIIQRWENYTKLKAIKL